MVLAGIPFDQTVDWAVMLSEQRECQVGKQSDQTWSLVVKQSGRTGNQTELQFDQTKVQVGMNSVQTLS